MIGESLEKPGLYCKLCDIQVLYRAFHEYLAEQYITAEELLEVLCRVAEHSELIRGSVIVLDGFTGFTPIQNKLMQKLMLYAGKVMVTLTVDSREDPFRAEGEHHLSEQKDGCYSKEAGSGSGGSFGGTADGKAVREKPSGTGGSFVLAGAEPFPV